MSVTSIFQSVSLPRPAIERGKHDNLNAHEICRHCLFAVIWLKEKEYLGAGNESLRPLASHINYNVLVCSS